MNPTSPMVGPALTAVFFLLAAAIPAQGIALRTGEVVIGRVVNVQASTIEIAVTFPRVETRVLKRGDIKPRSMYAILSGRMDQTSGTAHLELAQTCRELGLFAFGIAEARESARRDPALTDASNRLIKALRQSIATQLLRAATADAEAGLYGSAKLAAQTIVRDYSDTAAAGAARALLKQGSAAAGAARALLKKVRSVATPFARAVTEKEATAAIKKVRRALERSASDSAPPAHGKMRDQRRLQRGIARMEKTLQKLGSRISTLREEANALYQRSKELE